MTGLLNTRTSLAQRLDEEFSNTLENFFNFSDSKVNITEDEYKLQIVLPGFHKEEIEINIDNGILKVKAQTSREDFYKKSIVRKYTVPKDVNMEKVGAKLENGILSLSLPITKEEKSRRSIEIN